VGAILRSGAGRSLDANTRSFFEQAADPTSWILIGITYGFNPNRAFAINPQAIATCLSAVHLDATKLETLRLSGFSRGAQGVRETLRLGGLNSKVEQVFILDADYEHNAQVFANAHLDKKITFYHVTVNKKDKREALVPAKRNIVLGQWASQAIGYTRFIQDAAQTRGFTIPPAIQSQLLPLPPRGCFTTDKSLAGKTGGMCGVKGGTYVHWETWALAHQKEIETIVRSNVLKQFVDDNKLHKFPPEVPVSRVDDAHRYFVAEIAHELFAEPNP